MFDEINYTADSVNAFEERRVLRQIISNGVGYRFQRPELCREVISDTNRFHIYIWRTVRSANRLDYGRVLPENKRHFQSRENGYCMIDLDNVRLLVKGREFRIKNVIIGFTSYVTDENVLIGNRRWAYIPDTRFFVTPSTVYFLQVDQGYIPLSQFHMLSFISSDEGYESALVIDYDATQNSRPLVLLPCEENFDIIRSEIDCDDRAWGARLDAIAEEYRKCRL